MTEAAASSLRSEPADYVQTWAESLSQVMGQITGSPAPCTALAEKPMEMPPATDVELWIVCTNSGSLRGEMSLYLGQASALRLAQVFMSEPIAPEAQLSTERRDAVLEFLRQVAGLVTSSLKARWGDVQLRLETSPGPTSWPAASTFWLRVRQADPDALLLELGLSAALVAQLRTERAEAGKASNPVPASKLTAESDSKLDLLMDVELAMTLRFGGRCLLLREVLDLSPGSVVELDRRVETPVDLLLEGRLVARGEVVVIDGNYGMRVTEVVSAAVSQ